MVDIDGDGDAFVAQLEEANQQATLEISRKWHSRSDDLLLSRGESFDFDISSIVQGSVPPQWNSGEGGWEFAYPHEAAKYMELGADPHPIEADDAEMLAFEWPKMEGVEFGDTGQTFDEVFESSWPTVFLNEVEHPGTPALRFVSDAWKEVGPE